MARIPEIAAALACQSFIRDTATGSATLVNVFWNLLVPGPGRASFALYLKMVDGEGHYRAMVRLARLRDDKEILPLLASEFDWNDPLMPVEFGVHFASVPIEEEGLHELGIFLNDSYVGRTVFNVKWLGSPTGTGSN